jgi:succinate dehydrogenase/fumarate reductase flavoprotein subunit
MMALFKKPTTLEQAEKELKEALRALEDIRFRDPEEDSLDALEERISEAEDILWLATCAIDAYKDLKEREDK